MDLSWFKLTLTALARATYKHELHRLPERTRRPFLICLRELTGKSGSFAINCQSPAERMAYCWEARFLPRYPLIDWPFGRSLCYVIVRIVGTWFFGRRTVFGRDPRNPARSDRSAAVGQLVRTAAMHDRIRKDLERLQD